MVTMRVMPLARRRASTAVLAGPASIGVLMIVAGYPAGAALTDVLREEAP
jgi:hypothetical protein